MSDSISWTLLENIELPLDFFQPAENEAQAVEESIQKLLVLAAKGDQITMGESWWVDEHHPLAYHNRFGVTIHLLIPSVVEEEGLLEGFQICERVYNHYSQCHPPLFYFLRDPQALFQQTVDDAPLGFVGLAGGEVSQIWLYGTHTAYAITSCDSVSNDAWDRDMLEQLVHQSGLNAIFVENGTAEHDYLQGKKTIYQSGRMITDERNRNAA